MFEDKQSAESLNLSEPEPKAIKYNKKLMRNIAVLVLILFLISIFTVMNSASVPKAAEEKEELVFDYIGPRLLENSEKENLAASPYTLTNPEADARNLKSGSSIKSDGYNPLAGQKTNNLVPSALSVDGDISPGILSEYYEQQMLLKIKEEENAKNSSSSFTLKSEKKQSLRSSGGFTLRSGSIIPCTLITAINTDLSGVVTARVRENIYDSATGSKLLIPQGASIVGEYVSETAFGQNRADVVFSTINFPPDAKNPDGRSFSIQRLKASDLSGHSGLKDGVDYHFSKVALSVSASSLLAAIAKDDPSDTATFRERALSKSSENVSAIGKKYAGKQMSQKPTITIRGGAPFNIVISKDLKIPVYGA